MLFLTALVAKTRHFWNLLHLFEKVSQTELRSLSILKLELSEKIGEDLFSTF